MRANRFLIPTAIAAAALLALPAQALAVPSPLRPILEVFCQNADASFTAQFGYENTSAAAVTVPIGSHNKFKPAPDDRGQPTTFEPGVHAAAVTVVFAGGKLTWKLGSTSVSANARYPVPPCEPVPEATADLALAKASVFGFVSPPGGLERYTLTATNSGPDDATGVTVTDMLPAGTTYAAADSDPACVEAPAGTVTCTPTGGTLAVGQTIAFEIVVGTPATAGTITDTASVSAAQSDPNTANNTASAATDVLPANGDIAAAVVPPGGVLALGATSIAVDPEGETIALRLERSDTCAETCAEALIVDIGAGDEGTNTDPTRPLVLTWAVPIADLPPGTKLGSIVVLSDKNPDDGLQGEPLPICGSTALTGGPPVGSGVAEPSPCENSRRKDRHAGLFLFEILMLSNDPGFIIR